MRMSESSSQPARQPTRKIANQPVRQTDREKERGEQGQPNWSTSKRFNLTAFAMWLTTAGGKC